jgi:transcriptional regulator with XRE-family HTH domain
LKIFDFLLDSTEKVNRYIRFMSEDIENSEIPGENLTFAARIKKLRVNKGYSQKDIAEIIGVNYINYGRYERGLSRPSADTLTKLADAFGISVGYLLEGEQTDAAVADFKDKELLAMFKEVEKFSPKNKEHIKALIDAFIKKEKLQQLANAS